MSELRELARIAAPEIEPTLYIFTTLPNGMDFGGKGGWANRSCLPAMQHALESAGVWRGPGAIIAINPAETEFPAAVMAHELGHLCPYAPPYYIEPATPELVAADVRAHQHWAATPSPIAAAMPLWWQHESPWIRYTLHIVCRAWRAGFHFPLSAVCVAGPNYGLSSADEYLDALGSEIEDLAAATFAQIASTPAPKDFVDLWSRDTSGILLPLETEN